MCCMQILNKAMKVTVQHVNMERVLSAVSINQLQLTDLMSKLNKNKLERKLAPG